MANVAKGFGVGDTVYVWYKDSNSLNKLPQTRIVKKVNVDNANNTALVEFTDGDSIVDGVQAADLDATPNANTKRVFTTAALCAKDMVDNVISAFDELVALDVTTTGASTAAGTALSLVRGSVANP